MIEINLLPPELRKRKTPHLSHIPKTKLTLVVLGCLILLQLFLVSLAAINTRRLAKLSKTWQELSFNREQLEQFKGELNRINQKIFLIEQLISKRILWSKKLNQLSDLIVPGIWLNELSLKLKEEKIKKSEKAEQESFSALFISGSAASRTKDEPALIGRLMQNLKADPDFSADFAEIELGPIKKSFIAQTEVMDFVLICRFKEETVKK